MLRACLTALLAADICLSSGSTASTFTHGLWLSICAACKYNQADAMLSNNADIICLVLFYVGFWQTMLVMDMLQL